MSEHLRYEDAILRLARKAQGRRTHGSGFQYVFLVGAGASVSSHIPDGRTMCDQLRSKYPVTDDEIDKFERMGMTRYQATLRAIRDTLDDKFISRYIREMILNNARRPEPDGRWIVNNFYDTLANILAEKSYFCRVALTTNFDPLLYYAFIQNRNTEPVLIRHFEELESMRPREVYEEFPCLMYLHGYWQNHQLYNDPSQLGTYAAQWVEGLSQLLLEHDVIVVGYSGLEDSIALEWIRKCLQRGRDVFWCVHSPDGYLDNARVAQILAKLTIDSKLPLDRQNLKFAPIPNADRAALDLGKALGLPRATQLATLHDVFPWFSPAGMSVFANGGSVEPRAEGSLILDFAMGDDPFPGNNHAGINIDTVEHQLSLDGYNALSVEYTVEALTAPADAAGFEIKLHSEKNAWSYHLPLRPEGNSHLVLLDEYRRNDVDLRRIWRVVIAADVKCLGTSGGARITIKRTSLTK